MSQIKEPLCHLYSDLLQLGLMEHLGLDRQTFTPVFTRLRDYWVQALPSGVGGEYVMCSLLQLREILETPDDLEEIGCYLADATVRTYGNGSHQFVGEAVPALIDGKLVKTKEKLKEGIDLLASIGAAVSGGRRMYDCGKDFGTIAYKIKNGQITSLDQLKAHYPI